MGTELKDTFVQAYNDTYDYIDRYLTSKLPTRELIEDALQSVYLDFYRSLITTEGEIKNVRHYVLRIAKHYVADHYRQQPKATFEDITDLNRFACACWHNSKAVTPCKYAVYYLLLTVSELRMSEKVLKN